MTSNDNDWESLGDPIEALSRILDEYSQVREKMHEGHFEQYQDQLLNLYGSASGILISTKVTVSVPKFEITNSAGENVQKLVGWFGAFEKEFTRIRAQFLVAVAEKNAIDIVSQNLLFFDEVDRDHIQSLINELRDMISTTTLFEAGHRERLLKRLDALQAELRKTHTMPEKFLAFMGDCFAVAGQGGEDAKPLFDRLRELAEAVNRGRPEPRLVPQERDSRALARKEESPGDAPDQKDPEGEEV